MTVLPLVQYRIKGLVAGLFVGDLNGGGKLDPATLGDGIAGSFEMAFRGSG